MGFFGYDAQPMKGKAKVPPQPRFLRGRDWDKIDIDLAYELSARSLALWTRVAPHDGMPAYSGGLLDSWPAWAVDCVAICREETAVIREYLREARNG